MDDINNEVGRENPKLTAVDTIAQARNAAISWRGAERMRMDSLAQAKRDKKPIGNLDQVTPKQEQTILGESIEQAEAEVSLICDGWFFKEKDEPEYLALKNTLVEGKNESDTVTLAKAIRFGTESFYPSRDRNSAVEVIQALPAVLDDYKLRTELIDSLRQEVNRQGPMEIAKNGDDRVLAFLIEAQDVDEKTKQELVNWEQHIAGYRRGKQGDIIKSGGFLGDTEKELLTHLQSGSAGEKGTQQAVGYVEAVLTSRLRLSESRSSQETYARMSAAAAKILIAASGEDSVYDALKKTSLGNQGQRIKDMLLGDVDQILMEDHIGKLNKRQQDELKAKQAAPPVTMASERVAEVPAVNEEEARKPSTVVDTAAAETRIMFLLQAETEKIGDVKSLWKKGFFGLGGYEPTPRYVQISTDVGRRLLALSKSSPRTAQEEDQLTALQRVNQWLLRSNPSQKNK